MSQQDYELAAVQPSYYSAKVRSFLQYKRIPYQEIGANIETITQRLIPATGSHFIPAVICPDGKVLQDGCDILEELERRHPERPVMPEDADLKGLSYLLESLADNFFAMPMIYYRWVPEETKQWALNMFGIMGGKGLTDPALIELAQQAPAMLAADVQSRLPKAGLDKEESQQESIKITEKVCDLLDTHLASTPFIMGDRPSYGDFAIMNAMWGHLFLDPCDASTYIRKNCVHLTQWIGLMQSGAGIAHKGELYLADTMKDIFRYFSDVFSHMVQEILKAANNNLPKLSASEEVATGMGTLAKVETRLLNVPITVEMDNYYAWRLQRVMDEFKQDSSAGILEDVGFGFLADFTPAWRLEKQNNKLVSVLS